MKEESQSETGGYTHEKTTYLCVQYGYRLWELRFSDGSICSSDGITAENEIARNMYGDPTLDVTEQVNAEMHRQEFTANVSHELKTPLQSIIGSAELLENCIVKTEDVPRFVGHIRMEASRLVFLIDDIIRLSELEEGAEMPHEDIGNL